ncbi:hypothetical protein ACFL4A_02225 [bacterium]
MKGRSTEIEKVKRINTALKLLKEFASSQKAIEMMREEYGISRPQAYRYVQEALIRGQAMEIPEEKEAVIIKLPISLIKVVRGLSRKMKINISYIVTEALKGYIKENGK